MKRPPSKNLTNFHSFEDEFHLKRPHQLACGAVAGLTVQLAGLLWRLCSVGLSQQKPRMKRLRIPQAIRNKPSRMLLSSASEYSYDTRIFAMAAPPRAWRRSGTGGGAAGGGAAVAAGTVELEQRLLPATQPRASTSLLLLLFYSSPVSSSSPPPPGVPPVDAAGIKRLSKF